MTEWIYDAAAGRCRKVGGGQAMTRRKTDGERISTWVLNYGYNEIRLAARIDRLLRKRMAEAWGEGQACCFRYGELCINPYRGRAKK